MCVLTGYHASEGGRGVAALSSGRDVRRIAWQSGAGEVATWNQVFVLLVHSMVQILRHIFSQHCCAHQKIQMIFQKKKRTKLEKHAAQ